MAIIQDSIMTAVYKSTVEKGIKGKAARRRDDGVLKQALAIMKGIRDVFQAAPVLRTNMNISIQIINWNYLILWKLVLNIFFSSF